MNGQETLLAVLIINTQAMSKIIDLQGVHGLAGQEKK
jgi:hypothetical protein